MARRTWIAALAAGIAVAAVSGSGARQAGAQGQAFACSEATLEGTYGIQMQGTRTLPNGVTESLVGVAVRTYDGDGTFSQIDNIKGSVTGIVPDRPGGGTYEVTEDCRVVAQLQPAPGILIEERMVVVHDGSEVRSMTASPAGIMVTAVGKRMDRR
jgi:hypothetical protein